MKEQPSKGGRPEKEEEAKRDRFVQIRFTIAEYDAMVKRKATTQTKDLSTFIRAVCLEKPIRMKPQLTTHQEKVLSILRELRTDVLRIGVNINQSSKRINSTTDYQALQREVNSIQDNMSQIESDLNSLLKLVGQNGSPN